MHKGWIVDDTPVLLPLALQISHRRQGEPHVGIICPAEGCELPDGPSDDVEHLIVSLGIVDVKRRGCSQPQL